MTAAQVAHDMREYIEGHGWIQGAAVNTDGAVCLVGALCCVTYDAYKTDELRSASGRETTFEHALRRLTGAIGIVGWNDAPGRTYEDVILLLKRIEAGDGSG